MPTRLASPPAASASISADSTAMVAILLISPCSLRVSDHPYLTRERTADHARLGMRGASSAPLATRNRILAGGEGITQTGDFGRAERPTLSRAKHPNGIKRPGVEDVEGERVIGRVSPRRPRASCSGSPTSRRRAHAPGPPGWPAALGAAPHPVAKCPAWGRHRTAAAPCERARTGATARSSPTPTP